MARQSASVALEKDCMQIALLSFLWTCGAYVTSCGAYVTFLKGPHIILVESGSYDVPSVQEAQMKYDLFLVDFRGASQPAAIEGDPQPLHICFHLVIGNLQVRSRRKAQSVSLHCRRNLVTLCLRHLNTLLDTLENKPVVRCLVGDFNLTAEHVAAAVQDAPTSSSYSSLQLHHGLNAWEIHPSQHGLSGDLLVCAGAWLHSVEIPVGASFKDPGFRKDSHGVVGCTVQVPLTSPALQVAASHASAGVDSSSESLRSGASQSAVSGIQRVRSMSNDSDDQRGDDMDHRGFQPDFGADYDSDSRDSDNHEAAKTMCTVLRRQEEVESLFARNLLPLSSHVSSFYEEDHVQQRLRRQREER